MKKLLVLLMISIVMITGCSSKESGIENGKFTFGEFEIKKAYEEKYDRFLPKGIEIGEDTIKTSHMYKQELIDFLKVIDNSIDDKVIKMTLNSIEKNGSTDNYVTGENVSISVLDTSKAHTGDDIQYILLVIIPNNDIENKAMEDVANQW